MLIYKEENIHKYDKEQRQYYIKYVDSGVLRSSGSWLHKKRFLDKYELIYVSAGSLYLYTGQSKVVLHTGQLIILSPFQTIEGYRPSLQNLSFFWVTFSTDAPEQFHIPLQQIMTAKSEETEELLQKILRLSSQKVPSFLPDAHLMVLLSEIQTNASVPGSNQQLALRTNTYIEEHMAEGLSADSIASALNYNKDYISRTVKQYYGLSLKDLILQKRLGLARKLLTDSAYSIKQIAGILGFDTGNLFTKFIQYHIGMSPLEYRRQFS